MPVASVLIQLNSPAGVGLRFLASGPAYRGDVTSLEIQTRPAGRAYVSIAAAWLLTQRAGLALVGAVVLGQLSRLLFDALHQANVLTTGKPPVLGILGLVLALVCIGVVIWARVRVGKALNQWAQGSGLGLAVAESIPRRYVIANPGALLARALGTMLNLLLLLLMQNTVRAPAVLIASSYTSVAVADGVFVGLVVLLALVMLSNLYRTSKPVAAYLTWRGLDGVVPTAGFLAAGVAPALTAAKTATPPPQSEPRGKSGPPRSATPALDAGPPPADIDTIRATVRAPEETVRATAPPQEETIRATAPPQEETIRAPLPPQEETIRTPAPDDH
jgi:hypothetical protein